METRSPAVAGGPRLLLRLEGAALLVAAPAAMPFFDGPWWPFAAAAVAPDLALIGYLFGRGVGTASYNATHTTVPPLALAAFGLAAGTPIATAAALGWLAHIGFDRALGYGLKYSSAFVDTHLGRLGRDE